jgi:trehalose/maltose hydrolase-like predicted phosphorylase
VILAAALGRAESAAHYFQKNVTANMVFEGRQFVDNRFVGGTFPTAAGAAYVAALYGFGGLRHKDGFMICDARLPEAVTEMSFRVVNFTNVANVVVKPTGGRIAWEKIS